MKLDIKNFYPSIKREKIFYEFVNVGYNTEISNLLTNLCVIKNKLPQGAVTSPYLANLICRGLDMRVAGYCNKRNIIYTRYADDLTFSCDDRDLLRNIYGMIKKIVEDEGFKLNCNKTVFMTPKNHKKILGITINDNTIKAPKEMKKVIRAMIHYQVATGDYAANDKIRGYIACVDSIEDNFKKKCIEYYIKLSNSSLSLFSDIVKAYNNNKMFKELPDMVEKKSIDFVNYGDTEAFENMVYYEHENYLIAHGLAEAKEHSENVDVEELFN